MNNKNKNVREALKKIPSIDVILKKLPLEIPITFYKDYLNLILNEIRIEINNGKILNNIEKYCLTKVEKSIHKISENSLKSVINGTGIILHTGLGRAPISKNILIKGIKKKIILIQIKKLIFPNSVIIIKYNNQKINDDSINSVIIFLSAYISYLISSKSIHLFY